MLSKMFEACEDDYLRFDLVHNKRSQRPDLHAFILLDERIPGTTDLISCGSHDEYFLSITPDQLIAVATPNLVRELVRCGVRYDEHEESLCLFT